MVTLPEKKFMSVPTMFKVPMNLLFSTGLPSAENTWYQCTPDELIKQCLQRNEGALIEDGNFVTDKEKNPGSGTLVVYMVKDKMTENDVDWNEMNKSVDSKYFDSLYKKMIDHLGKKEIWIRDAFSFTGNKKRLNIRSINEDPAGNLFVHNMFLEPSKNDLINFNPDWYIIHTSEFFADPETDGVNEKEYIMINFSRKVILIGGRKFNEQIKKSIFSILDLNRE